MCKNIVSPVRSLLARIRGERRREKKELQLDLETTVRLLRRLGYQEVSADHVSRLRLSEDALRFLLANGYTNISSLQLAAMTRVGLFRVRRGGRATKREDRVATEVMEALVEYAQINLRLLREARRRLARDSRS